MSQEFAPPRQRPVQLTGERPHPTEDAEVVRRLRAGGAIILGKQNMHEFAYGGSSMTSFFGEVHNPWDTKRIAGGSSEARPPA